MPLADPSFALLLGASVLAALVVGFLKTSLGGGIGLVLTPTLTLVLPAPTALALLAALLLLSDPLAVRLYWRTWDARQLRLLLPSSLVGVVAGMWVLSLLSPVGMRRTIGVAAIVFALAQLTLARGTGSLFGASPHWSAGVVAGLITGFASVIAHSGGLVMGLYLLSLGLPGALVVGTANAVTVLADVLKLAGYWQIGFVSPSLPLASVLGVPSLAVGAWLGFRVNQRLPRRAFEIALVIIAIAGSLRLLLA